jgi:hypothetical protein
MRFCVGILAVAAVLVSSGCLRTETRHALYLSPDGNLRWVVDESNVASDESDEGKQLEEEQAYIRAALVGTHRVAQGLQVIAPDDAPRTTVIRDERPFHVITEARFAQVDRALERLFKTCGLPTSVDLTRDGDVARLRLRFDFRRGIAERDTPALALLEELQEFRFVLTRGRFVEGGGFEVVDRANAKLSRESLRRFEAAMESGHVVEFVLSWSADR